MYINFSRIHTFEDVLNQADTTPRYIKDELEVYKDDATGYIFLVLDEEAILMAFAPETVSTDSEYSCKLVRDRRFEYGGYRLIPRSAKKIEVKDKDLRTFLDTAYSTSREVTASSYREQTAILLERCSDIPYDIARVVVKLIDKVTEDQLLEITRNFKELVKSCAKVLADTPDYEKILSEFRPLAEKKLVFFRIFGEEWYNLLGIENLGTKYTLAIAEYLIQELISFQQYKFIDGINN